MSIQSSLEEYNKQVQKVKPLELEIRFDKIRNKTIFENIFNTLCQYGFKRISEKYYLKAIINSKDDLNNIRCEIEGLGNIESFCNTNILPENTSFIKKISRMDKIYNKDYGFSNALSNEKKIDSKDVIYKIYKKWSNLDKFYRLMNRITLKHDTISNFVIDMSIVKSKKSDNFRTSGIFEEKEEYELEIELNEQNENINIKEVSEQLKQIVKYILCGRDETKFPIPYREKKLILSKYHSLFNGTKKNTFIGPSSVTLKKINLIELPNNSEHVCVLNDFCITDKADGLRKLLYISEEGKIYFLTNTYPMNVQFTGRNLDIKHKKKYDLENVLLDGEYIEYDKDRNRIDLFMAFDIYFINGKDLRNNDFEYRYKQLNKIILIINEMSDNKKYGYCIQFECKKFYFINEKYDLFYNCDRLLSEIKSHTYRYNTDGIIFSSSTLGVTKESHEDSVQNKKYTWKHSLKWKPPEFNTIDFKIKIPLDNEKKEKIEFIYDVHSNSTIKYKLVHLYVGNNSKGNNIDTQISILKQIEQKKHSSQEEILFIPDNPYDKDAYKCYLKMEEDDKLYVEEEGTNGRDIIEHDYVVEFKYDIKQDNKYLRWIPLRIRYDKTFGNAFTTANDNWNTIHNPILETMLTKDKLELSDIVDQDVYYNNRKKSDKKTEKLREFHNGYIKLRLLQSICDEDSSLIDFAVGKAGDLHKWASCKIKTILGIDLSKDNIHNVNDGACSRYLKTFPNDEKKYIFITGDSSKLIKNGDMGKDDMISKEVLEHMFHQKDHSKKYIGLPSFSITQHGFDVGSIQFAIHYFFKDKYTLNGFIKNCADSIRKNGYLIGTCYDGERIFNLLKKENKKELFVEDEKIWHIQKKYKETEFISDESCLGYEIGVYQYSINQEISEYLVNFKYLITIMKEYGFEIPKNKKIKLFGKDPIDNFEVFYKHYEKDKKHMSEEEKQISFLNNYFIFQKIHDYDTESIYKLNLKQEKTMTKRDIINNSKVTQLKVPPIILNNE